MPTLCRLLGGGLLLAALVRIWRARSTGPTARSPAGGLAFGLEVWSALMAAGEPVSSAVAATATCCPPATGAVLRSVASGLAAGLPCARAWEVALAGLEVPAWTRAAQACVRSERDGAPLAPVLRRLAADERAAAASRGLVAARRAGVLAVLPLGLCTLPAYLLLSMAPAVVGLVRQAT